MARNTPGSGSFVTERRLSERKAPEQLTYIGLPSGNGGIVLNVSERGLGFQAVAPVKPCKPIAFWFSAMFFSADSDRTLCSADTNRIESNGELVWTDEAKKVGGLRFTQLSAGVREQIRNWANESDRPLCSRQESAGPRWVEELPDVPAPDESPALTNQTRMDSAPTSDALPAADCNICVRSERAGQRVMESVTHLITHRLKLKVNQAKSAVARPGQRKFLGFTFTGEREPRRRLVPKAPARFKERIRGVTRRTRGISLKQMVREIATYLRGWLPYFGGAVRPQWVEELPDLSARDESSPLTNETRMGSASRSDALPAAEVLWRETHEQVPGSPHLEGQSRVRFKAVGVFVLALIIAVLGYTYRKVTGVRYTATPTEAAPQSSTTPTPETAKANAAMPPAPQALTADATHRKSPSSGGALFVQVGAFIQEENASKVAESLRQENFPALIVTSKDGALYLVHAGPYADEESARIAESELEEAGFEPFIRH